PRPRATRKPRLPQRTRQRRPETSSAAPPKSTVARTNDVAVALTSLVRRDSNNHVAGGRAERQQRPPGGGCLRQRLGMPGRSARGAERSSGWPSSSACSGAGLAARSAAEPVAAAVLSEAALSAAVPTGEGCPARRWYSLTSRVHR